MGIDIKKKKLNAFLIVISYFIFFLGYAYIRYVHFKGMDLLVNANFIINKAFAGAAITSVFTSYMLSTLAKNGNTFAKRHHIYCRFLGLGGFYFMILHVFFAFRVVSPDNLPQFFDVGNELSLKGKFIFLLGITGFSLFLFPAISSIKEVIAKLSPRKWKLLQRIGYIAYGIILVHVSIIGYSNWFSIEKWPGLMPPITLISFCIIFTALFYRLLTYFNTGK